MLLLGGSVSLSFKRNAAAHYSGPASFCCFGARLLSPLSIDFCSLASSLLLASCLQANKRHGQAGFGGRGQGRCFAGGHRAASRVERAEVRHLLLRGGGVHPRADHFWVWGPARCPTSHPSFLGGKRIQPTQTDKNIFLQKKVATNLV